VFSVISSTGKILLSRIKNYGKPELHDCNGVSFLIDTGKAFMF